MTGETGFLKGSIDLPVIGSAPKWAVYGVGGVAVVYVGYKWWQSSSAPEPIETVDPGYQDDGTVPPGDDSMEPGTGGIPPMNGGGQPPSQSDYGFTGTDNDQWAQYATIQLTQSAEWEYTAIVTALGNYLARRMLTEQQVQIVQAAIAVAGYPPEGQYTIKRPNGGGDGAPTLSPPNVRLSSTGRTHITIRWDRVPGAENYKVYRDGSYAEMGGTDLVSKVEGLSAGTRYSLTVTAVNEAGAEGPHSSPVSATTDRAPDPEPEPKPDRNRRRTWRISSSNRTLSELVHAYNRRYGTSHSWQEIWNYNLRHRSKSTQRTLRKRGPNKVYRGSAFWFPY